MARHHHHNNNHTSTPQAIHRPPLLRYLSLLALILPPIFYLISMSLTLAIQYNENYALTNLYNSSGLPTGQRISASPFFLCDRLPIEFIDDISDFTWSCKRDVLFGKGALEKCYERFKPGYDEVQKCQKIVGSAGLYVAGAVLVGLAVLGAIAVAGAGFKNAWATHEYAGGYEYAPVHAAKDDTAQETHPNPAVYSPYTNSKIGTEVMFSFTTLLAVLATGCLVFAQILGVQSLVNEQHPTAGESPGDGPIGRWYMGTPAQVWSTVAWLSAAIGVFIAVAGRVGSR